MAHLLVAISPHGFGHLSQVAAVLEKLRIRLPGLQVTLRTTLPRKRLEQRIAPPFSLQPAADDFGMLQHNALEMDLQASLQRYRELHDNWQHQVKRVAAELVAAKPDLVFADVPYLTLAAASEAGIPSVAMCSLNWAEIVAGCLKGEADVEAMVACMNAAYNSAQYFLCPEPSMPMPGLANCRAVSVVATEATNRRARLIEQGLVAEHERLVLVAMGGIDHPLPVAEWPKARHIRYLLPAAWDVERDDCLTIDELDYSFSDLVASSDAVITKPGYGTFTEAAVHAVSVLYVRRGNWPEEPALMRWIQQAVSSKEVTRGVLERGEHLPALESLLSQPEPVPVPATGADEAAVILQEMLVD